MWKRHLKHTFSGEKKIVLSFFPTLVGHFQTQESFINVILDDYSFSRGRYYPVGNKPAEICQGWNCAGGNCPGRDFFWVGNALGGAARGGTVLVGE